MKLAEKIENLNNANIGSLGEFIFENRFKEKGVIIKKHNERTDFLFNKQQIDIKTKRKLDRKFERISKYYGNRVSGVKYILVEIFSDKIVISNEKKVLDDFDWNTLIYLFSDWENGKKIIKKQKIRNSTSIYKKKHIEIVNELKYFFKNTNRKVRVIYRTTQDIFGKESPDNLIPKVLTENSFTVFIDYKNYKTTRENIRQIIAFPDMDSVFFQHLKSPKLHIEKVDLSMLDNKYKFSSIEALKERYS
ncbi:MAG: hypothetical protein RBT49_00780 [Bacteroidales bacterium]|jgi:hypothetical protein|nr:hypothetical protein [Bacteroidales bacterium]